MKNKKRKISKSAVSLIIFSIIVAVFCIRVITIEKSLYYFRSTINHNVEKEENLWEIAESYKTPKQDTRKVIFLIKEKNDLKSNNLQVGDMLEIPVFTTKK
jgi:hypothetical protein